MKLLKALLNSLVCGLFFCCLLALLFADLNINSSLDLFFLGRLALVLFITYGLIAAFLCLAAFAIYTFFSSRKNIAFVSPTFLSLGFSFLSLVFLLIFRGNTAYFQSFFGAHTQTLLQHQMIAILALVVAGPLACFLFYRYRKHKFFFMAYFLVMAGLLGYTFSQRPDNSFPESPGKLIALETRNSGKKVTILELEGLSFDFIIPLISQDKLPNFSLLVEQGSWGRLESFTPNDPLILDNSFNTGKFPAKHRQVSPFTYRVGSFKQELEIIPRFLFFRQLTRTGLLKLSPNRPAYRPKDIWRIFGDIRMPQLRRDDPEGADVRRTTAKADTLFNMFYRDLQNDHNPIFALAKQAFLRDSMYAEAASQERVASAPQIYGLQLDGLNVAERYFYRYSFPDLFGNVSSEDVTRYGSVIERYYKFYDEVIGKYLTSLKEDELFIVFSPNGIEPLPFWKRVVEWVSGNTDVSAFHEMAPEGAVFFYGKSINREKDIEGMRLVDIAPTLLYYLGLPVGKDMDGIVRSSLFVRDFISDNPIMTISSYEDYALKPGRQNP